MRIQRKCDTVADVTDTADQDLPPRTNAGQFHQLGGESWGTLIPHFEAYVIPSGQRAFWTFGDKDGFSTFSREIYK